MNHQITLVGGQWLPVYLGIKEYHSFLVSSLSFLFTTIDNILFTIFEGSKM